MFALWVFFIFVNGFILYRLFYTKVGIGTPSKDYHLQVDTGSDILWVNCAGCKNCPKETKLDVCPFVNLTFFNSICL